MTTLIGLILIWLFCLVLLIAVIFCAALFYKYLVDFVFWLAEKITGNHYG